MFFERSQNLWEKSISEKLKLIVANGKLAKSRIWPEQNFAKRIWQVRLNHVDAPCTKTNNFVKYFFPMSVHFISNIKGFW